MDVTLIKLPTGALAPYGDESIDYVRRVKTGRLLRAKVAQVRNYEFHKKAFALLDFAYDTWSEDLPTQTYKGQLVLPSKERFRHDMTILAGYYVPVFAINGELRLEPKSWSFTSMEQDEFEGLYSKLIDVILSKILAGKQGQWTEEKLRAHVDEVLRFDSGG